MRDPHGQAGKILSSGPDTGRDGLRGVMGARIPVVVDDRERRSPVRAELDHCGVFELSTERLACGDYLVDGRFLFERKTLPDLAVSIKQGRLFSQALRLAGAEPRAALILEGTSGDLRGCGMRWEATQGALVTVSLFVGLPVLRSRTPRETALTFLFAARQGRVIASGALPRRGHRPKGKAGLQRHILQGFHRIGPERAGRLLQRFGSVEAVLAAGEDELRSVPGIGRRTARLLRWAVEEPKPEYRAVRKTRRRRKIRKTPPPFKGTYPLTEEMLDSARHQGRE